MNTNHTPAPWGFDKYEQVIDANGQQILVTGLALTTGNHPKQQEAKANARLIAAAPELLEALNAIVKRAEDPALCDDTDALLRNARAAIAKATGEKA